MTNPFASLLSLPAISRLSREALLAMEPETAHGATIAALRLGLSPVSQVPDDPALATEIAGLGLPNPIGMAAGFDKNAEVPAALGRIGFGFVEVGTLTPRPQAGNPRPRLFRVPLYQGVINRMGFNNCGHDEAYERLVRARPATVTGVNIGANKDTTDFVADYVLGVRRFAPVADYLTVNISSPNTPGLRDLQTEEALARLLAEVLAERARQSVRVPLFLKLAPDLGERDLDAIAKTVLATDLDGLIVSNTTTRRDLVDAAPEKAETGGLSGRPLFAFSTQRLAQLRQRVGPDMPIIGVGGIHSGKSALAKFAAGANAIQLYSALVYGGMGLVDEIKTELLIAARAAGGIRALTGTAVNDWAEGRASL